MEQRTLFADYEIKTVDKTQKTKRIIVMDGGERKNTVKVWDSATTTEYTLTFDEYIEMFFMDGFQGIRFDEYDETHFVSELAHWLLQNEFSLSQIFTEEKMTTIVKRVSEKDNFIMSAWSEKMTTSALKLYNGEKDKDDCAAIAHYIEYHDYYNDMKKINSISDLKPNKVIQQGNQYRSEHWNKHMNKAQKVNYGLPKKQGIYQNLDLCPVMRDIILPNWEYLEKNLSPELQKLWMRNSKGKTWRQLYEKNRTLANFPNEHVDIVKHRHLIEVVKRTKDSKSGEFKKGDIDIVDWIPQIRGIYSAFNGIFDFDSNLRKHPMPSYDGQLMSNKWLHDHYIVDKQHHQQGGVGRAIHYHYVFPPYVADCWEDTHGANTWPRYSQNYKCPHTGKNKRNNRGSLTKEQDDFLVETRRSIRTKIRDEIWNTFREKYR